MADSVHPLREAAALEALWSPRVIAEVEDSYVKVARVHGTLCWHTHEEEDELFYVLRGRLTIEMKDRSVELEEGDLFVVPKGVAHNPVAEEQCLVLLVEKKSTAHTGSTRTDRTRSIEEQLRGIG